MSAQEWDILEGPSKGELYQLMFNKHTARFRIRLYDGLESWKNIGVRSIGTADAQGNRTIEGFMAEPILPGPGRSVGRGYTITPIEGVYNPSIHSGIMLIHKDKAREVE
jgi:hypothetical protein